MDPKQTASCQKAFVWKMEQEGLDPLVIDTFIYYFQKVIAGDKGVIPQDEVRSIKPKRFPHIDDLKTITDTGEKHFEQTVLVILNGGLGTGMGLSVAKSLIEVKDSKSFLEIKLAQAESKNIAVCLMNSFNTHADTLSAVSSRKSSRIPFSFIQNKFPKILKTDFAPAVWSQNPNLEWNPPGHGDLYTALCSSGILAELLKKGFRYAFVSNSDNLGATIDASLLGYFVDNEFPFMMEISRRRPSDIKGGHLAWHQSGRILLREIAQCPEEDLEDFQNIDLHRYFNTNNIWIDLEALNSLIDRTGLVRLPMILNSKTLDPRDENSPPVYQVETAMGSAVSLFKEATVVRVERNRFLPVKNCNELMVIRSDRYLLDQENFLIRNPANQTGMTTIRLDPKFYAKTDMFDQRFAAGIPSLTHCSSLSVEGDVRFQKHITIKGDVSIQNTRKSQAVIKAGTIIKEDLIFD